MAHDPAFFNRFAIIMIAVTTIIFPLLVWGIVALVGRIVKFFSPITSHYLYLAAITLGVFVLLIMLIGHFWGPKHLVVRNETVKSAQIPAAFNDYKIVHITDFHLLSQQNQPEFVTQVVEKINSLQPDIICFTGDLVTATLLEAKPYKHILSKLHAKDGVFSVLGNHDYHIYTGLSKKEQVQWVKQFAADQRAMGWNILLNENHIIHHGGDSIAIVGCENDGTPPHFPQYADLKKSFAGISDNSDNNCNGAVIPCQILLSHDPTHWRRSILKETNALLTLSGHTHAMQFSIFGWSPASLIYKEWCGLYEQDSRFLNVSSGLGGAGLPFRFGAWPEICLITLKLDSIN